MVNIKIQTKGMHCQSCEILIKDGLKELEGINRVEASHKSGIVSVDFDDKKLSEKEIIEVVKLEGYEIQ